MKARARFVPTSHLPIKSEKSLRQRMCESQLQRLQGSTTQPVIHQDERHHRFCDRHGARAQTGIMTTMDFEVNRYTVLGH